MSGKTEILKISLFGSVNEASDQLLAFDVVQENENLAVCVPLMKDTIENLIVSYFNSEFSYDIENINEIEGAESYLAEVVSNIETKLMQWWEAKQVLSITSKNPLMYGGVKLNCYVFISKTLLLGS